MNIPRIQSVLVVVAACLVGLISWNESIYGLLAAPCLVLLWRFSTSRVSAAATTFGYYLAVGRGLFEGAGVFFGHSSTLPAWGYGLFIWIVPNAILAIIWGLAWSKHNQAWRVLIALFVVSIPPIGVFGWANPLTSAGSYFPNTGWFGFLLLLVFLLAFAQARRLFIPICLLFILATTANFLYREPVLNTWVAVNTHLGESQTTGDEFDRLQILQNLVSAQSSNPNIKVIVLPELVGGEWSVNESWWDLTDKMLATRGQTALVGAHWSQITSGRTQYINALFSLGQDQGVVLADRVPVPISMWVPFSGQGAQKFWSGSGINRIGDKSVASLICYEELLMWPVLVSMSHRPDVIIGSANDWWARGTNIPNIQHKAVNAWSRLFGIPNVWAFNE